MDAIARLEYALFGTDDDNTNFENRQPVPSPSQHPSDSSGQFTHPYQEPSPPSSTSPLYLRGGLAIDIPGNSPWTFTPLSPPSLPPDPPHDDFHGCTSSHPGNNHPSNQPSQPHESVCNITIQKQNNTPHTMTTIYTQKHEASGDAPVT